MKNPNILKKSNPNICWGRNNKEKVIQVYAWNKNAKHTQYMLEIIKKILISGYLCVFKSHFYLYKNRMRKFSDIGIKNIFYI